LVFSKTTGDYDYDPNAAELDISEEELQLRMNLVLEKLNNEAANQQLINATEKKNSRTK
jgi:hypothetical protein